VPPAPIEPPAPEVNAPVIVAAPEVAIVVVDKLAMAS